MPDYLLLQTNPNGGEIRTPCLLVCRHRLHTRTPRLEPKPRVLVPRCPGGPLGRTRRAVSVRVVGADEAGPVGLGDGDDGAVGAAGGVGGGRAAVGVGGAKDGVEFDCVAYAEAWEMDVLVGVVLMLRGWNEGVNFLT